MPSKQAHMQAGPGVTSGTAMPLRVQAPMQSSKPRYAWSHSLAYNVQRKTCGELAALLYKSAPQLSTAMHPNFQPVKVRTSDGGWRHGYACIRPPSANPLINPRCEVV